MNLGGLWKELVDHFAFSNPIANVCAILYFTNKIEKFCGSNIVVFLGQTQQSGPLGRWNKGETRLSGEVELLTVHQWIRLCASAADNTGSIPGPGVLHAAGQCGPNKQKTLCGGIGNAWGRGAAVGRGPGNRGRAEAGPLA